jgi:hypothetical protein
MRESALSVALVFTALFQLCASQQPSKERTTPIYYELYSWQDSGSREWSFSIMYNTNRQKTVKEVFDKKKVREGLDQLKLTISGIPKGSVIVWLDRLTLAGGKLKGSERLRYPSDEIVSEIRRYAQTLDIKVTGPPTTPVP